MHKATPFACVRRLIGAGLLAAGCSDSVSPSHHAPAAPPLPQLGGDIPGLVAYWKLDEAAGATSFTDYSGSGITGSCTGSACPALGVSGKVGTAAQFTRADLDRITFGTPPALNFGTSSFSYGFWAYVVGVPASSSQIAWYKGGASAGDAGFDIEISAFGNGWNANISDGVTIRTVVGGVIHANQWTHLIAVVDRTAGTLTLYEDGSVVSSTSLGLLGSVTSARTPALSCNFGTSFCLDGTLDDVRIYNRALTATEVQNLFAPPAGRHFYASPSGNDANPCSASAPCYRMSRVSQLLAPGDTAHFASGNYTWSWSENKVSKSGTASAYITYISDVKWGAKIYGPTCAPIYNDGDYVQIINFDVTTGTCPDGIITNGNYSKVIGNRVHDLPGSSGGVAGILGDCCYYNRTGIQIIGNVVDNIGPWGGTNTIHGIYVAGPNGVIMNNIVTRASAACITSWHGATRLIISNNTVANCGRYGIQVSADGTLTTNDSTTVDNNIVVNVAGYGIQEWPATGSNNVYNNNIVYNNSPNFSLRTGTQSGTITLTPAQFNALFVNYTGDMNGNYHLRSGAVAVDAGTTSCARGVSGCVPLNDFDGVVRPQGATWDMGAYELIP